MISDEELCPDFDIGIIGRGAQDVCLTHSRPPHESYVGGVGAEGSMGASLVTQNLAFAI